MKRVLIVIALVAVFGFAQTTNPTVPVFSPPQFSWGGPLANNVSQCKSPGTGGASICPVQNSDGSVSYWQWNGTAFALASGIPGPQGPQGPAGATGPQGPAGPVQSFAAQQCTTSNLSNSGFTASGCTEK